MHVNNADLHCSYSAPVRVSVAEFVVVAARAETFRVVVIERADVRVAVFVFCGIKILIGFAARGVTVVFIGVRVVTERDVLAVVTVVLFPREMAFSSRTAPPAFSVQKQIAQIKSKNFFISALMLANL